MDVPPTDLYHQHNCNFSRVREVTCAVFSLEPSQAAARVQNDLIVSCGSNRTCTDGSICGLFILITDSLLTEMHAC